MSIIVLRAVINKFFLEVFMKFSLFVGVKNDRRWYALKYGELYVSMDMGIISQLCLLLRVFPEDLQLGDNFIN